MIEVSKNIITNHNHCKEGTISSYCDLINNKSLARFNPSFSNVLLLYEEKFYTTFERISISHHMIKFLNSLILTFLPFFAFSQADYFDPEFLRNQDYVYDSNIKTVLLYKAGFQLSAPVIQLNSDERLILSFDDLSGSYKRYDYTVIHCDADWNISDLLPNEYLESFTDDYIRDFKYSYNTIQDYVHYRLELPNEIIRMTLSGNYLLKVYPAGYPERPVLTRRFFVYDEKATVQVQVRPSSNVAERNFKQELTFTISAPRLIINDPQNEIKVTIRQNGRWDNCITNLKPWEFRSGQLIFRDVGSFVFDGGNDFRYFDMKSLRYNSMRVSFINFTPTEGYQVYLYPDEVRKKYVYSRIQESINGRFLIKTEDQPDSDIQSEYAWVHFFLAYPEPITTGKLYISGEFTLWQFRNENELIFNPEQRGYEGKLLLKQGFYNYQYLFLPNQSQRGDVSFIEGNFFETNNEYTFYIYYRPIGSRYDQLVNVTFVMAHPN